MIEIPTSPKRTANEDRYGHPGGKTPCYICAKPIANERIRHMIHVHCGGGMAVTEEEAAKLDPAGDLGGQPIGPECLKKHPELKPYVHNAE